MDYTGGFGLIVFVFLLVLAILWFILPFAVFGIKNRLDKIIEQNREIIQLTAIMADRGDGG